MISVNVGLPKVVEWRGKSVETGIFKAPVAGPIAVKRLNLAGDGQADLSVHGGPEKAVYAYPAEHYAFWSGELGIDLEWGAFGENLTVTGIDVVRILPLLIVIALLGLTGVRAQSLLSNRLYLPLMRAARTTPTHPTTATVRPTATAVLTPTNPPPPVVVSGNVRLRPETADLRPSDPNPRRYVVLLDVSGSQNMNFAGQGYADNAAIQCAPGPPGAPPS